ncbi:MAG: protein kinase [Acidobacteriia bacterium]|nr:protein kinase [Terriglobia bacterium]
MPLSTGEKLGPYEIISPLGVGGMGEVYRARDTKLGRQVALKVLAPTLAGDAQYMARFQREAKVLASLNHPNIAAIYGLEENALVMELVEGETLRGPLPVETALAYARQMTDALEYAHEKGVVHRDLKPANVKVTPDGVVKILDFGLAKVAEETVSSGNPDTSPTLTMAATRMGAILGTAGYMAPEQARGQVVDKRADIWAFGVVGYEMVTGQRLFHGETVGDTLAEVLKKEINLDAAPAEVRPVLRRCLERDRKKRLRDIGDAWCVGPEFAPTAGRRSSVLPWAVAAVCLVAAVLGWGAWMRKSSEPVLPVVLTVEPPEGSRFGSIGNMGGSAISPDGRTLAFVATTAKGETLLHLRPLESLAARALPGTEEAGRPFWSPDSKSVAFVAGGKLKRIDVAGGVPITLCDARFARGGTWNEEGVILFGDQAQALQRIPASGGTPSWVTRVNKEAGETAHYYPRFLPGGKEFLYLVRHSDPEKMGIHIGALDAKPGSPAARIVQTEYKAAYDAASGRLLYMQGAGTLMARKLELDPPGLAGDPVTVAEGVRIGANNGYAEFSISGNGTLFYGRGSAFEKVRFGWRDRGGKLLETIGQPAQVGFTFSLSPDGGRVVYSSGSGLSQSDIWVLELARGLSTRVTFGQSNWPRWSPDGKQLYYSNRSGIHRKAADGSGEEELLMKVTQSNFVRSVSPDGKYLLFGNGDIMTLPLTGERKAEAYLQTKYNEIGAAFSPDGRWVAYDSDESGRVEIYVQGFPERRGKWLVSADGGRQPAWRADGKELYWAGLNNTLMAASIELQAAGVRPGRAEALFRLPASDTFPAYQPSRDGRRFLVYEPEGRQQELPMVVVENWAGRLGK